MSRQETKVPNPSPGGRRGVLTRKHRREIHLRPEAAEDRRRSLRWQGRLLVCRARSRQYKYVTVKVHPRHSDFLVLQAMKVAERTRYMSQPLTLLVAVFASFVLAMISCSASGRNNRRLWCLKEYQKLRRQEDKDFTVKVRLDASFSDFLSESPAVTPCMRS